MLYLKWHNQEHYATISVAFKHHLYRKLMISALHCVLRDILSNLFITDTKILRIVYRDYCLYVPMNVRNIIVISFSSKLYHPNKGD